MITARKSGAVEAPVFDECLLYAENAENITITGGGVIIPWARRGVSSRKNGELGTVR
jgi:hypothetical protein